jgi:hypothetical protein
MDRDLQLDDDELGAVVPRRHSHLHYPFFFGNSNEQMAIATGPYRFTLLYGAYLPTARITGPCFGRPQSSPDEKPKPWSAVLCPIAGPP